MHPVHDMTFHCKPKLRQATMRRWIELALQGALIFLCGGDKDLYEFSGPLLDVMGKAKFYLGEVFPLAHLEAILQCQEGIAL